MDTTTEQTTFDAILRNDFASFIGKTFETVVPASSYISNWHIEAIAWHLQQCAEKKIRRLIITLPPRSLKSICASVAFPAWLLGHDPGARIVCASYASELSGKHANDCRAAIAGVLPSVLGGPTFRHRLSAPHGWSAFLGNAIRPCLTENSFRVVNARGPTWDKA